MAIIDKIYGTKKQHKELRAWIKANRPHLLKNVYKWYAWYDQREPGGTFAIANFSTEADVDLYHNCPLQWVVDYIRMQYGGEPKIMADAKEALTPQSKDWEAFIEILAGPQGCNFRENDEGHMLWNCRGGHNKDLASAILNAEPFSNYDKEATLQYFDEHGGHCDCEIVFNIY